MAQWSNLESQMAKYYKDMQSSMKLKDDSILKLEQTLAQLQQDFIFNLELMAERDGDLKLQEQELEMLSRNCRELQQQNDLINKERNEYARQNSSFRLGNESIILEHKQAMIEQDRGFKRQDQIKARHLQAIQQEREKDAMEIYGKVDAVKHEYSVKAKHLEMELDQLRQDHIAELSSLSKVQCTEKISLSSRIAQLSGELIFAQSANHTKVHDLAVAADSIKNLEKFIAELKWESADVNKMTAGRILELESVIKEGDALAEKERGEWDIERQRIRQDAELEKKAHWNTQLLEEKLDSTISSLDGQIQEKEGLKADLQRAECNSKRELDKKDTEILSLLFQIKETEKVQIRNLEGLHRDMARYQEQDELWQTRFSQIRDENVKKDLDIDQLRQDLEDTYRKDLHAEDQMTQEQFVIESQYQLEMKRQVKGFDTKLQTMQRENSALLSEIKALKSRSTQLEASSVDMEARNEAYLDRARDLENENQELQEVVYQMRTDMENVNLPNEDNLELILQDREAEIEMLYREGGEETRLLRERLDEALHQLKRTAKENAHLLDMSNGLRASFKKAAVKHSAVQCEKVDSNDAKSTRIPFKASTKPNEKIKQIKVSADQFRQALGKTKGVRNYNEKLQ